MFNRDVNCERSEAIKRGIAEARAKRGGVLRKSRPSKFASMGGQRFGSWVATNETSRSERGDLLVKFACDCGTIALRVPADIVKGRSLSCGCTRNVTHGMSDTAEYRAWGNMLCRCNNPNIPKHKDYGGRGIAVCERWTSFKNFLADMGERPDGMTLERIDVNGNYEPGNCRWATPLEQSRNTRSNSMLSLFGVSACKSHWAQCCGVKVSTLNKRLLKGLSVQQALGVADIHIAWG
ncbi:Rz-like spanin [Ralstonia phage AhaGv]|nr:Rz-like spanin [Ralstonia phage AhaGv]